MMYSLLVSAPESWTIHEECLSSSLGLRLSFSISFNSNLTLFPQDSVQSFIRELRHSVTVSGALTLPEKTAVLVTNRGILFLV